MEGLPGDPASRSRRGGGVLTSRRLVLWRHGRTAWNADGRFQGQLDPPLDDTGRSQAGAAARVLAHLQPSLIVASDLERAADTAKVLAESVGMSARLDPRLREIDLGNWQGLHRAEIAERFPEEFAAWLAGEDVRRGSGETYAEVGARASAAIDEAFAEVAEDAVVVAVTHGGAARSAIGVLIGLDHASWWRLGPLGNCRWSVLVESEHGWRLAEHNAGVSEEIVAALAGPSGDDTPLRG